ncbi:hypothetical protein LHYA1_G009033 [Lachnellula hyalina]|uniref:Uncharacterized protein n=1 Tax=Lachnellula hyalina TaxID=1316788 RepID=A0A8H8QT19_9HELO|nr:uncharacterized protein LHYA1_G009033 [Lachnellula hyalina]TVY22253.1 hypothetical protein LHYA1_G009033 [Lachnellula hyalina]
MWQRATSYDDDPFTSPAQEVTPSANYGWENRVRRPSRFSAPRFTPFRTGLLLLAIGIIVLFRDYIPSPASRQMPRNHRNLQHNNHSPCCLPTPESSLYRILDIIDTFHSYKFPDTCNVSSLDLHAPFGPLCHDRASMLTAMSSGGRIGHDAPYMPRGCDMRWFTSEEVRYGTSNWRLNAAPFNREHHILIRRDLGHGAVTDWNFSTQESKECFCNEQFDVKACSVQGIYKTADVLTNDPDSLSCANSINVMIEQIVRFPIPTEEIISLKASIGTEGDKPKAVIFGHGLWSNLDLQKTVNWLDAVLEAIGPGFAPQGHSLFGNKALMLFEEAVSVEAAKKGVEHLGTWNMSIQSNKYDGVHLDMKGNLVKAMMVMNWLNLIEN